MFLRISAPRFLAECRKRVTARGNLHVWFFEPHNFPCTVYKYSLFYLFMFCIYNLYSLSIIFFSVTGSAGSKSAVRTLSVRLRGDDVGSSRPTRRVTFCSREDLVMMMWLIVWRALARSYEDRCDVDREDIDLVVRRLLM